MNIDRNTAEALLRALTGGKNPPRNSVPVFDLREDGKNVGWDYKPYSNTIDDPDEPASPTSPNPPSTVNIYNRIAVNVHGTDSDVPRINALMNLWIGTAYPNNRQEPDAWITI